MSKHLPNCPHLSKYDGLGDAGIIMAINEKHRKNDSYQNNEYMDDVIDQVINTIDKTEDYFDQMDRYVDSLKSRIEYLEKEREKYCRDAYVEGYKQCKRDLKKKVYRSPYLAFIEYWDRQSQ